MNKSVDAKHLDNNKKNLIVVRIIFAFKITENIYSMGKQLKKINEFK